MMTGLGVRQTGHSSGLVTISSAPAVRSAVALPETSTAWPGRVRAVTLRCSLVKRPSWAMVAMTRRRAGSAFARRSALARGGGERLRRAGLADDGLWRARVLAAGAERGDLLHLGSGSLGGSQRGARSRGAAPMNARARAAVP
mmetsp:Transcript_34091/g.104714  ORF Transcript_34091/g.104714 Transcript_34091/m.104714 type:complete len:143 (-) Transcript_34091:54-482(-)